MMSAPDGATHPAIAATLGWMNTANRNTSSWISVRLPAQSPTASSTWLHCVVVRPPPGFGAPVPQGMAITFIPASIDKPSLAFWGTFAFYYPGGTKTVCPRRLSTLRR
jgi:hypothetical protein